jgi:hypothetical protein
MMPASACALSAIWSRYWRRRSSPMSGARASRPGRSCRCSGVRNSWLVLARKALLARLAASAASRARASACSNWRRSVTSSHDPDRAAFGRMARVDGLGRARAPGRCCRRGGGQCARTRPARRGQRGPNLLRRARSRLVGPHHGARLADQAARAASRTSARSAGWPARSAVAGDGDADRGAVSRMASRSSRARVRLGDVARVDHQVLAPVHHEAGADTSMGTALPPPLADEGQRRQVLTEPCSRSRAMNSLRVRRRRPTGPAPAPCGPPPRSDRSSR